MIARSRVTEALKSNIQFWRDIGANSYILDTIEKGYVIPFHSTPGSMCCKNNRLALQHKTFVLEAISDLEKKGLVFEDCWMIKFDIHSAYHHISIRESQTGMLGFSWQI